MNTQTSPSIPELSIVIPTHDRPHLLDECLSSISRQTIASSRFEVVVVSNFSDGRVAKICERARLLGISVRLLVCGRVGVNTARNLGAEHALGQILFFLDDDCRLIRPDHLERLLDIFHARPEIERVGGLYQDPKNASQSCRDYNALVNAWLHSHSNHQHGPYVFPGGNLCLRQELFAQGHRFDAEIIYGGSESPLQYRLNNRGSFGWFAADLAIEHEFHGGKRDLLRKAWLQGKGRIHLPKPQMDPAVRAKNFWRAQQASSLSFREKLRQMTITVLYSAIARTAGASAFLIRTASQSMKDLSSRKISRFKLW